MGIRANAFSSDITPQEPVQLAGFPCKTRVSTGTRDKLLASAVHIRGGGGGTILVSLDLYCLDPEFARSIRAKIVKATGTRAQNVFVGTTMNHSGPFANTPMNRYGDPSFSEPAVEYLAYVEEQAVQAAAESAVASRPASMAAVPLPGPGCGVVVVRDTLANRISALIISGNVVPRALGMGNTQVSADFLAAARKKIGEGLGYEPVIAYFVASSAEQRLASPAATAGDPVAAVADAFAAEVVAAVKSLAPASFSDRDEVSGRILPVHGIRRKILPDIVGAGLMHEAARKAVAKIEAGGGDIRLAKWAEIEAGYAVNFLMARQAERLIEAIEGSDPAELQVMNFGKAKLLGLPWVSFPEVGKKLAEQAGGLLLMAECTNGDLQGSVMVPDQSKPGVFNLLSPLFELDNGEALFKSAQSLLAPPPSRIPRV